MRTLLIDNGTSLLEKLEQLIPAHEVVKKFADLESLDIESFDLIVLSGSAKHNVLFEDADFNAEIKILHSGRPVVGICFGCELITQAFGGSLIELPELEKGIYDVEILDKALGERVVKVYEGHRWAISKVPDEFEVLAKSERGPEIIKHKILPIYGLQFHPENMVEKTDGDELFLKLLSNFNIHG